MSGVERLSQMIAGARTIVAFTGAGISTESGIPDFRSPGGIWTRMRPIEFGAFIRSAEARRESWRRKFATDETMRNATPNAGHRSLARLYTEGRMAAVITQNIDGLHQASGLPDDAVIELHGNGTYAGCLDCKKRYELDWVREVFSDEAAVMELYANPEGQELLDDLVAACNQVTLSRRFLNDAVQATRLLRQGRLVRMFRLAGNAAEPQMVEFDDAPPRTFALLA